MLLLTRKKKQALIINDHVTVTVLNVRRGQVRLSIEAPKDVTVYRDEIYKLMKNESVKDKSTDNE